jgi:hypothetical protein
VDIGVRARLTPAEMRRVTDELARANLIEEPSPDLIRLSENGRKVLMEHRLERELGESAPRRHRAKRPKGTGQRSADLDLAIEDTVRSLRARHAH